MGNEKISLRKARILAGRTQSDVANAVGITRPCYSSYEKEPHKIRVGVAKDIVSYLGYEIEDINFFAS